MTLDLTILHTNDLHNHLDAEQAQRLSSLKTDCGPHTLLLDAGDAISSGNVTYKAGGEPILDLMSSARYDAMAIGNREFHFTQAGFTAKVNRAKFATLSANVRARGGQSVLPVNPYVTFTIEGRRITVLGLTVPMITERMAVRRVSAYVFDDPIRCAQQIVPLIRSESDLVICLTHIGVARDRELACSVPGIDLIVGGHTHVTLDEGERVNDTLIVQAGSWARYVGMVCINLDHDAPRMQAKLITL